MSSHRAKWNYKAPTNHNVIARIKGKTQQGFTILEVIIVLVIAAIIMITVFLVVPQLNRSQRNSRNQDNARRALTAVTQYSANNNGAAPTATTSVGFCVEV